MEMKLGFYCQVIAGRDSIFALKKSHPPPIFLQAGE